MEKHANAKREGAPAYRVGDWVLEPQEYQNRSPSLKLDHKAFGEYQIKEVLGTHTYRLDLPFEYSGPTSFIQTYFATPHGTSCLVRNRTLYHPPSPLTKTERNCGLLKLYWTPNARREMASSTLSYGEDTMLTTSLGSP